MTLTPSPLSRVITVLDRILSGPTAFLRTYKKLVSYGLLALSIGSIGFLFLPETGGLTGILAWYILLLIVFIGPFFRIMRMPFLGALIGYRKELGILMGMLAFIHAQVVILGYPPLADDTSWPILTGKLALLMTIPLLLTSNTYSMKFLKKYWKRLHSLVPVILVLSGIHAALVSGHFFIYGLPMVVYTIVKILDWRGYTITPPSDDARITP